MGSENTLHSKGRPAEANEEVEKKEPGKETGEDVESAFFEQGDRGDLIHLIRGVAQDVVGRELKDSEVARIQKEAGQRLKRERSLMHRLFKEYGAHLKRGLALILGLGTIASIKYESKPAPPPEPAAEVSPEQQARIEDKAVQAELDKEVAEDLFTIAEGAAEAFKGSPEYQGRLGLETWSTPERVSYTKLPTEAKLYALHPEFADLSDTQFLNRFSDLMEAAGTEFRPY